MELRRSAKITSTGRQGFVLETLTKVAANGSEVAVFLFEDASATPQAGTVTEEPATTIAFTDGGPANPTILP